MPELTPEYFLQLLRDPQVTMGVETILSIKSGADSEQTTLESNISLFFTRSHAHTSEVV